MGSSELEKKLRESESRYRAVVEDQLDLICRFTPDFRLTFVNEAYCRFSGMKKEDLIGVKWLDFLPVDEQKMVLERLEGITRDNPLLTYEHQVKLANGGIGWQQWSDRALFGDDGTLLEFQSVGRDITEMKQAGAFIEIQRDLAVAMGSSVEIKESLGLILDALFSVDEIDGAGIYLYDRKTGDLVLVNYRGFSGEFVERVKKVPRDSHRSELVMKGMPVFETIGAGAGADPARVGERLTALGVIPVLHENAVVGSLNIGSRITADFPPRVRDFALAIAGQIGGVIARIRRNEDLLVSQENLSNLFDRLDDLIFIIAMNGTIISVNNGVVRKLGYTPDELVGKNFLLFHPAERAGEVNAVFEDMTAGRRDTCLIPLVSKMGGEVPVETKVAIGRWNGEDAVFGISRDLTDLRRFERELAAGRERLDLALHGADLALWDWNVATGDVVYNRRWIEMLGYEEGEIEPRINAWDKLLHPDDRGYVTEALERHLRGEADSYETEHRLRRRDGTWIWVLDRGKVVERDGSGAPRRAVGTHMDVTDRIELIEALRSKTAELERSEGRYRGLLESQNDLIVRVDPEGNFTYVNDAYCRTFGKNREELLGNSFQPLVHPDDIEATREAMKGLERPPHRIYVEQRARTVRGWRWFAWEDYAIKDDAGLTIEIQGVGRDISDQKLAEEKIINARNEAEAANRAKSTFLANMSHELRTPMNAIIGISGVLRKKTEGLTPNFIEGLDLINESGRRLLVLINDLLDLSKIEAGKMSLTCAEVTIEKLLGGIDKTMAGLLGAKPVTFSIKIENGNNTVLYSDRDKVYQILINLLGNAAKFTESGAIVLTVTAEKHRISFEVSDTGIGISEEHLKRIFDPFYQADGSLSKRFPGTGLGLALSLSLAHLLGGIIEIESNEFRGTSATLILPRNEAPAAEGSRPSGPQEKQRGPKQPRRAGPTEGPSVLVIDDDHSARETIRLILEDDYCVRIASSGREGVKLFAGEAADAVLLDIMMPEIDGFITFNMIRNIDRQVPIIAVTARAMPEERQKIIDHGFNAYISKPVDPDSLRKTLSELFAG